MGTLPNPVPAPADPSAHPAWCDPDQCVAAGPPFYHRGVPRPFAASAGGGGISGQAQVWLNSDEPLFESDPSVVLTFDQTVITPMVWSFDLRPAEVSALVDALALAEVEMSGRGTRPGLLPGAGKKAPADEKGAALESTPGGCPSWCAGGHGAEQPVHTVDVGTVEMTDGMAVVEAAKYGDLPAGCALYLLEPELTRVVNMTAEQARALGLALIAAASVAGVA